MSDDYTQRIKIDSKNLEAMKLMHYFITDKNYNPIVVQGLDDEIWLENLDEEYKVIRIVSGYIHNDEQYDYNQFRANRIISKIKKKTFSFSMNTLNIYLDLGDNVTKFDENSKHSINIKLNKESDFKSSGLLDFFPDIISKTKFKESGIALFSRITSDINKVAKKDGEKFSKLFSPKTPLVTYILIALNVFLYFMPIIFGIYNEVISRFAISGFLIRNGEYYRLLSGIFLHGSLLHLLFNMYALWVLGKQLESLVGRGKFCVIYFISGLCGSLFSMLFNHNVFSVGASGAIFGLMGSLLFFGYHYRVYFGNTIIREILPVVLINLLFGFSSSNVDNFAHIGGLIGGFMITSGLGIDDKSSRSDRINGLIVITIFIAFLIYMAFWYVK